MAPDHCWRPPVRKPIRRNRHLVDPRPSSHGADLPGDGPKRRGAAVGASELVPEHAEDRERREIAHRMRLGPLADRVTIASGQSALAARRAIVLRDTGWVSGSDDRRALECDYDVCPERMRLAREVLRCYGDSGDVHTVVAARLIAEGLLPVLDIGCGEGELARHLPQGAWVGVDASPTMVAAAPAGARVGDALALPFASGLFAAAALLYVLYHLDRPAAALAEARRVLRPGGLVVTAAPSRHDSPELAFALPAVRSLTFDAEIAPGLMADYFIDVEVQSWDGPLLTLPDRTSVRDYLIGKGTDLGTASRAASAVDVPLTITKRGAMVWGRAPAPEAPVSPDATVGTHP